MRAGRQRARPKTWQTPGPSGTALYTRWCGPARARVHVVGASFLIRGGRSVRDPRSCFVRVGLSTNPPARPAKWVGLFIRNRRAAAHGGASDLRTRPRTSRTRTSSSAAPNSRQRAGRLPSGDRCALGHWHSVSGTRRALRAAGTAAEAPRGIGPTWSTACGCRLIRPDSRPRLDRRHPRIP